MNLIKALRHSTPDHNGPEREKKKTLEYNQTICSTENIDSHLYYNPREVRRRQKKSHSRFSFLMNTFELRFETWVNETHLLYEQLQLLLLPRSLVRSFSLLFVSVLLCAECWLSSISYLAVKKNLSPLLMFLRCDTRVGGLEWSMNGLDWIERQAGKGKEKQLSLRVECFVEACRLSLKGRSWERLREKDDVGIKTQHNTTISKVIRCCNKIETNCDHKMSWKMEKFRIFEVRVLNGLPRRVIISRSVRLHCNFIFMCILIGFRFVFCVSFTHSLIHPLISSHRSSFACSPFEFELVAY